MVIFRSAKTRIFSLLGIALALVLGHLFKEDLKNIANKTILPVALADEPAPQSDGNSACATGGSGGTGGGSGGSTGGSGSTGW